VNLSRSLTTLALSVLLVLLAACGKVGPPVPPHHISERSSDLQAVQRGATIVLSWPGPPLNQKQSINTVDRAEVYRLEERRDQEPTLDREDYRNSAHEVGTLSRLDIEDQLTRFGFLHYTDPLDLTRPKDLSNLRLRYAVRYVNTREQQAPFSNTVAIEPVSVVSLAPDGPEVEGQAQDRVMLVWNPPAANVDGSTPANVVGYNLYRLRVAGDGQPELLNPEPLGDTRFTDTKFKYEVLYLYTVRALSQGSTGLIESADSVGKTLIPKDTFKPSAPDPVSIASANSVISLFWPSSPERDVVGYIVYRSESPEPTPGDWIRLTPEPITAVTYRDEHVRLEKRYYYRVTAIDKFKNESESSKIVSEVANP
jgi:hypothetical protein